MKNPSVAILLGNVAGGLMIAVPENRPLSSGRQPVLVCSRIRPFDCASGTGASPGTDPGLKINWNPVSETLRNLAMARQNQRRSLDAGHQLDVVFWRGFFKSIS